MPVAVATLMTTMRAWISDERPRERLSTTGPAGLADAELIAILLGSGMTGRSVLEVAGGLLRRVGNLRGLAEAAAEELRAEPGVGPVRATIIQAALELGKRTTGQRPARGRRLARAEDVWAHLRARLAACPVEEFWSLALDARHRVQSETCLARGSLTGVEVHPRDVFRPLIRTSAASVIFCHNHPSGDPAPSQQDLDLTARLRQVGELCGIVVLDHVIVAAEGYTSLGDRGWA